MWYLKYTQCINYFSVALIKYHDQDNLQRSLFALWFYRARVHNCEDSVAVCSRHGGRNREPKAHILKHKHGMERANWLYNLNPSSTNVFPPTRPCQCFPKQFKCVRL